MPNIQSLATDNDRALVEADFPGVAPEALFRYSVQPDLLTQWWPQEAEVEAHVDGRYHLAWPGMNWHLRGVYTVFEPGKKLAFTWNWDHQPQLPQRTVEIEFTPVGVSPRSYRTVVHVTHGTYGDSPIEQDDRQSHIDGWLHFLAQLQNLLVQ